MRGKRSPWHQICHTTRAGFLLSIPELLANISLALSASDNQPAAPETVFRSSGQRETSAASSW